MQVRRLAAVSVLAIGLALLVPGWPQPAGASTKITILAPTSVKAISVDGVRGVLVSWEPPPASGPTVDYYVAYTYNQKHTCREPGTGPYHCVLTGLNGNQIFPIRIRAITDSGKSPPVHAAQTVIRPGTSEPSPASPGQPGQPAQPAQPAATTATPTVPTNPADASPTPATTASSTTAARGTLEELPFTGIDVPTLLLVGLILVASGLLLVSSSAQRRGVRRRLLGWMFGI